MAAFITLPIEELITSASTGYSTYNSAYGHCKVSYDSTYREFTSIVNSDNILFTIIDNQELYYQIYPNAVGAYLAIGGIAFSKNALPFDMANYNLRNGSPEGSTVSWYNHNIDNEFSQPINGKQYLTSPVYLRTSAKETLTHEYTGIYAGITHINSLSELVAAITEFGIRPIDSNYPITYRLTNCTAPDAPSEASIGSTVTVPFVFPDGYGIVNNENVYVTNNGVTVPSTYSDGVLTFEMPNPN